MNKTIVWVALAVVVGGGLGAFYYLWTHPQEPAPVTEEESPADPAPYEPEAAVRHPVPQAPREPETDTPPPSLEHSDGSVRASLAELYGERGIAEYLMPERIVRRIVITVDNLPREKLAVQMRPLRPLGGTTAVEGDPELDDIVTLSPENYARYKPVLAWVRGTDTEQLATLYFRLYPLFQQAYEELGYPGKYFNDRLVETIDHLLATPEVSGDIRLVRPKVFFEFADPELERRSAGQKLLIRMGPENAALVKDKLRELRAQVTRQGAP